MAQSAPSRTLHELADGVYVWLQPGGESGVSNAGVIVDDDGVTIVDTMMVRSQWEPFADAVKALDVPMRRIVLTHGHIDHVGGTKAFPHAGVFASPQTSAVLDQHMPIDAYRTFMSAFEEEFDDLAELGTRPATHLIDGAAYVNLMSIGAFRTMLPLIVLPRHDVSKKEPIPVTPAAVMLLLLIVLFVTAPHPSMPASHTFRIVLS